ncbi:hypothetical protein LX36DRAFT_660098 [Colletotrichum falcatum]|nr:hypothetical protein LX36DRAFT_660098 [Colletotrichum falcatum]
MPDQLDCLFSWQNRRGTVGRLCGHVSRLVNHISKAVDACALQPYTNMALFSTRRRWTPLAERDSKLNAPRAGRAEICHSNSPGCKRGVDAWQGSNKSQRTGQKGRLRTNGKDPRNPPSPLSVLRLRKSTEDRRERKREEDQSLVVGLSPWTFHLECYV